ncbi:MAG: EamA family transporter [Cellulomonadaceae bacterium]
MSRIPAPVLFLVSGITQYVGAGVAVGLFARIEAPAVAWARIAIAAVLLIAWRRPWRAQWTRAGLVRAAGFGAVLAAMNVTFYMSLVYLPLGNAVAIEFVGPVLVGALAGRGWRERAAIVLAAAGVVLIAGFTLADGGPGSGKGLVLILLAAVFWAGYIVLGRRVSVVRPSEPHGVTALSVSMLVGALVFAPWLAPEVVPSFADPSMAALLVAVAVCSSVIPYGIDQVVLRRSGTAQFAVLLSMFPATALLVGAVMLGQLPHWFEVLGLACVSVAIALTSRPSRPAAPA